MKVKLLTGLSGAKQTLNKGDIYTCSKAEAERLIAAGIAEKAATKAAKRETAAKKTPAKETRSAVDKVKDVVNTSSARARQLMRSDPIED